MPRFYGIGVNMSKKICSGGVSPPECKGLKSFKNGNLTVRDGKPVPYEALFNQRLSYAVRNAA